MVLPSSHGVFCLLDEGVGRLVLEFSLEGVSNLSPGLLVTLLALKIDGIRVLVGSIPVTDSSSTETIETGIDTSKSRTINIRTDGITGCALRNPPRTLGIPVCTVTRRKLQKERENDLAAIFRTLWREIKVSQHRNLPFCLSQSRTLLGGARPRQLLFPPQ